MPIRTLILTALATEARAIARECGVAFPRRAQAVDLPHPAQLRIIGLRATRMTTDICIGFDQIILAGLAGGLDPALQIGDIIIDAPPDFPHPNGIYRFGSIYGSDQLIFSPAAKSELFTRTAALAADMESHIVRRFATQAGVPLIIIRSISDTADQSLRPQVLSWLDPDGRPHPAAVAAGLARNPSLIPHLIRLARNSQRAVRNLGIVVRTLIA